MQYEVEQKFAVVDIEEIRARLVPLGATFAEPVVQCDHYLAHPARSFAETDEALRIRTVGESSFVTYKGPKIDTETKTRREIELPIGVGNEVSGNFIELFEALGFTTVAEVRKRRLPAVVNWNATCIEVVLDDVEHVGTFVELERCVDEQAIEAAKVAINEFAAMLGLEHIERRSYLEMLLVAQE